MSGATTTCSPPAALAPLLLRALCLTTREREIAQHLLVGRPRTQIARALGLSDHTLGDHVRNVYRKAGVSGRAELAALLYTATTPDPGPLGSPPTPTAGSHSPARYRPDGLSLTAKGWARGPGGKAQSR